MDEYNKPLTTQHNKRNKLYLVCLKEPLNYTHKSLVYPVLPTSIGKDD